VIQTILHTNSWHILYRYAFVISIRKGDLMSNDTQSRLKSKVLWLGIATQIGIILVTLGVFDNTMLEDYKIIVNSVLAILSAFSIINNPTSKNTL